MLGTIAFSARPGFVKLALELTPDPITLLGWRMLLSLPCFMAVAAWMELRRRRRPRPIRSKNPGLRDGTVIVGLGMLGYWVASTLDYLGLQYVSASLGRLLLFAYPTIVLILSFLFFGKRPKPVELAALAATYAGLVIVMWPGLAGDNPSLLHGAILILGSGTSFAVFLVGAGHMTQRYGSLSFTAWAMCVASLCCVLQFLVLRPVAALAVPWPVFWLCVTIAIVSTVLPVFAVGEALRRIGATRVALIGALGPVSAIIFGALGLDEDIGIEQLAGSALIIAGVLLVTVRPKPADG